MKASEEVFTAHGSNLVLTPREATVLNLLRQGKTNKEIAVALSRSVKTAEFHVRNVLWKTNARTRRELLLRTD